MRPAAKPRAEIERLLTVQQVAELLALSPKTIYAWATARRIPCVRLGGCLRFSEHDLRVWLDAKKDNSRVQRGVW
jgi:excisionase family DNA binding protein